MVPEVPARDESSAVDPETSLIPDRREDPGVEGAEMDPFPPAYIPPPRPAPPPASDSDSDEGEQERRGERGTEEAHLATDDKAALARLQILRSEPAATTSSRSNATEDVEEEEEEREDVPDEEDLVLHELEAHTQNQSLSLPSDATTSSSSHPVPAPSSPSATTAPDKTLLDPLPRHISRTIRSSSPPPPSRSLQSSASTPTPGLHPPQHRRHLSEESSHDEVGDLVPAYDEIPSSSTSQPERAVVLPEPVVHPAIVREYARLAAASDSVPDVDGDGDDLDLRASASAPPLELEAEEDEPVPSAPPAWD